MSNAAKRLNGHIAVGDPESMAVGDSESMAVWLKILRSTISAVTALVYELRFRRCTYCFEVSQHPSMHDLLQEF